MQKEKKLANLSEETTEAPRLTYAVGYTRNMGQFESLRIDIGLTDSLRVGETPEQALERIAEFCDETLLTKLQEVQADVESTK